MNEINSIGYCQKIELRTTNRMLYSVKRDSNNGCKGALIDYNKRRYNRIRLWINTNKLTIGG